MASKSYPSLSKMQPFGGKKDNNPSSNSGLFIFTISSLKRVAGRAFTVGAAFAGALYVFNAIDSLISGNDILTNNNNNNKRKNGRD